MKQFYSTGLRILSWAALCAAVITSSCSSDDTDDNGNGNGGSTPPPTVTLDDQIEYDGGDLIDIKSAIYAIDEENDKLYTFYLSPIEDITTVKGMEATDDYLKVSVEDPAGTVDTGDQLFSIDYKDISVSKTSMVGYATVNLSANLLPQSGQLVLYVSVETNNGKTLLVRFNNKCTRYQLPTLDNQYGIDDAVTNIGSVVEWIDLEAGTTTYYVYEQEGMTAPSPDVTPGLTIQLASDIDPEQIVSGRLTAGSRLDIDFSKDDVSKITVESGEFKAGGTTAGVTGTLSLRKDRNNASNLIIELDIQNADLRLRADYGFDLATASYKSENRMTSTLSGSEVENGTLTQLFRYSDPTGVYRFAFGLPVVDPEEPKEGVAALTTGHYAVQINVSTANLGKTFDLSDENQQIGLFVYDYVTYRTFDLAKISDVTGKVLVADGGSNRYYVNVDVTFPDGPTIKSEWFGAITPETSPFEETLTPVEPYNPTILIRKSDESELLRKTLDRVEVRMQKNYELRGGDAAAAWTGGATFDAYFFYFVPEGVTDGIEEFRTIPQFMIPASFVPTPGESLNIGANADVSNLHWTFKYMAEGFLDKGSAEYTEKYASYAYCPDTATVSITKNDDNTWRITFQMIDSGKASSPWGTNNTLTIDWEGPLTKYSGTNANDLEDSFYGE